VILREGIEKREGKRKSDHQYPGGEREMSDVRKED